MRLFGYYAWHSFINQVKKLLHTWVLIFIVVCALMGGLIGYMAASLSDTASESEQFYEDVTDIMDLEESMPAEEEPAEPAEQEAAEETEGEPEESLMPVSGGAILELAVGALVFIYLMYRALTADKNGSAIFQPADAILLFGSPMTPQAVLFFRLMTQLGAMLALTIYMGLQIPNLVLNVGMTLPAAVAALGAWLFSLFMGTVLSTLIYLLCDQYEFVRKNLHKILYGLVAVVALGFLAFRRSTELPLWEAADAFFNSKISRFIPLWGWIKALPAYANEGNYLGVAVMVVLNALMIFALITVIRRIPADFYEDAAAKSEETAALRKKAQEGIGVAVRTSKRKKSEKIERDGFRFGAGANVFFYKALYNRWRFARFHFVTATTTTYLAAALGMAAVLLFIAESRVYAPVTFTLGVLVFFRSLGNPLGEDTKMDYFRSIPESSAKKIFWSLLGGNVNSLLDLLPGAVLAGILLRTSPFEVIGSLAFILTVDLFSTIVGTFIDLSVPVNAGKTVKQYVQVFFIYFGLLPDIAVIAVCSIYGHDALGLVLAAFVNLLLTGVFFVITPRLLEPVERPHLEPLAEPDAEAQRSARRTIGGAEFAAFVFLIASVVAQIASGVLGKVFADVLPDNGWTFWIMNMGPIYLIGVPAALLVFAQIKSSPPRGDTPSAGLTARAFFICEFAMYAGNILGMLVMMKLQDYMQTETTNPVLVLTDQGGILQRLVFFVIMAPVFEELIFRKMLIDRIRPYGEGLSILMSGLMFGLFHGNFSQFFYATLMGMVLAYVYLRTGKLRNTILLHSLINLNGGVISIEIVKRIPLEMSLGDILQLGEIPPAIIIYIGYLMMILGFGVIGAVFFFSGLPRMKLARGEKELPFKTGSKIAFANIGWILFFIGTAALFVWSFMP